MTRIAHTKKPSKREPVIRLRAVLQPLAKSPHRDTAWAAFGGAANRIAPGADRLSREQLIAIRRALHDAIGVVDAALSLDQRKRGRVVRGGAR